MARSGSFMSIEWSINRPLGPPFRSDSGLITLVVKCAGTRSAGNPHTTCDVAGAGNEAPIYLGVVAPVSDPTGDDHSWCSKLKDDARVYFCGKGHLSQLHILLGRMRAIDAPRTENDAGYPCSRELACVRAVRDANGAARSSYLLRDTLSHLHDPGGNGSLHR
jgi:hypothetical protein